MGVGLTLGHQLTTDKALTNTISEPQISHSLSYSLLSGSEMLDDAKGYVFLQYEAESTLNWFKRRQVS